MHSGMMARFMFHEYIDHTYLPHPCGGLSVARKTFFLLSLHISATSASHHKATLSNIISNRPNTPSPPLPSPSHPLSLPFNNPPQNPTLPSHIPHTTSPHPHIPSQHPPTTDLIPHAPAPTPEDNFIFISSARIRKNGCGGFLRRGMLLLGSRREERGRKRGKKEEEGRRRVVVKRKR
jgi:hypothetical protein